MKLFSLAILTPVAVICIGIGMVLGSLFTENQVAAAGSIIIVVISLFSGAWMNLEMVGGVFEKVGYILPFAHAVDAARAVINGAQLSAVSDKLYWIVSYLVVFICAGILSFRRFHC
ncbi:MAG: ABC transporter permease [Bacillota bacterium]|nr:ABC transporter permease [Bacillota bacterium]